MAMFLVVGIVLVVIIVIVIVMALVIEINKVHSISRDRIGFLSASGVLVGIDVLSKNYSHGYTKREVLRAHRQTGRLG